jgi:cytochrome c556
VETQALPALSKDHAGFERAAAYYAAATARLSELAAANDTAGFTKQLEKVNEACNACHATYKQTPPAGHGK